MAIPAAERAVSLGRVDLDDLDPERRGWTAQRLLDELRRTRPTAEDLVVCHGDPCLANVLFDDGRLTGVIDVGRLGVADRYHDLAIATRSPANNWGPLYPTGSSSDTGSQLDGLTRRRSASTGCSTSSSDDRAARPRRRVPSRSPFAAGR